LVRRPCPNHLLDSACRRSAPSIKQRSNLILSGNGSSARPYSSQLASQMHLHSPSAITMTAVSGIGLSLISSPATFHVSPRKPQCSEWKVCAGVPPTPLIARWSKSPWSAGQPDRMARGPGQPASMPQDPNAFTDSQVPISEARPDSFQSSHGFSTSCRKSLREDVRYWHFSDIPPAPSNVRYRG
jgi:hypothetical protein